MYFMGVGGKKMESKYSLFYDLKQLFHDHKHKMTFYVVAVLWIAVIMQIAVTSFMQTEDNILEALVRTNSEVNAFELETAAEFGNGYLSIEAKEEVIRLVAEKIGLEVDEEIEVLKQGNNSEVFIDKTSKNARTLIKLVSVEEEDSLGVVEMNHYILVRLKVNENLNSIVQYRDLLNKILSDLNSSNIQTTMQLIGTYQGKLSLDQMNAIADNMIKLLHGEVSYENRQEDFFTVYAYSGLLEEYITSMGTKINIHIATNFDETTDTTMLYLGAPVIKADY